MGQFYKKCSKFNYFTLQEFILDLRISQLLPTKALFISNKKILPLDISCCTLKINSPHLLLNYADHFTFLLWLTQEYGWKLLSKG